MANRGVLSRWTKFYANGYDLTGHTRQYGELGVDYDVVDMTAVSDAIKSGLLSLGNPSLGAINTIFDTTALTGLHTIAIAWAGNGHRVMIPMGVGANPVIGDPVFAGAFMLDAYKFQVSDQSAFCNFQWGKWDESQVLGYSNAFGILQHAKTAETGVNAGTGVDGGASSNFGAWMQYQIFAVSGTGNVTIKIQDAAVNSDGNFADVAGLTSGAIAHTSVPTSGIIALATTATVRQFTRWQIALSGITSVTFALSLHRAKF